MAQPITSAMTFKMPDFYYNKIWLKTLEDHLEYLKSHPRTAERTVSTQKLHLFKYNFYGFLQDQNIDNKNFYLLARLNDITNPFLWEPKPDFKLRVPDPNLMAEIFKLSNLSLSNSINR